MSGTVSFKKTVYYYTIYQNNTGRFSPRAYDLSSYRILAG